jgi:hypothetical protein
VPSDLRTWMNLSRPVICSRMGASSIATGALNPHLTPIALGLRSRSYSLAASESCHTGGSAQNKKPQSYIREKVGSDKVIIVLEWHYSNHSLAREGSSPLALVQPRRIQVLPRQAFVQNTVETRYPGMENVYKTESLGA